MVYLIFWLPWLHSSVWWWVSVESGYPCFVTDQKTSTFSPTKYHQCSLRIPPPPDIPHVRSRTSFFNPSWWWRLGSYFSCISQYKDDPVVVSFSWWPGTWVSYIKAFLYSWDKSLVSDLCIYWWIGFGSTLLRVLSISQCYGSANSVSLEILVLFSIRVILAS